MGIVVGQKRHQTRFFKADDDDKGKACGKGGKGKADEFGKGGKGKGKGKPDNVPAGTVAGEGIADVGHLNFYLVAHEGNLGTSVPCHYHVLHLDPRLNLGANDIERITYDLCHLYSRADKTVSYASPAYLADHLCERGKLYLDTLYDGNKDLEATGNLSDDEEEQFRQSVEERVEDFNQNRTRILSKSKLADLHYFC